MTSHSVCIDDASAGQRLDKALPLALPHLTRSRVQQLIASGQVTRDGTAVADGNHKVKRGETYVLREPAPESLDLVPLAMDLDILFEDDQLIVINKPAGLTVHPAAGNRNNTLVNALLYHCGDTLSGIGGVARPGIVHRIDKDTSGLLVVAKTDSAHQHLSAQLRSRALKRSYLTYVWGAPKQSMGFVNAPIERHKLKRKEMAVVEEGKGRHALTHYKVEALYPPFVPEAGSDNRYPPPNRRGNLVASKVHCELDTGRTHQIRVHLRHIGCPMIGDQTYGLSSKSTLNIIHKGGIVAGSETEKVVMTLSRQALHARMLRFNHPVSDAPLQFEAPIPDDLLALEQALASLG